MVFCEYSKLRLCDIFVGEFSKVLGGYVFIFSSLAGGASMWLFMRICTHEFQMGSRLAMVLLMNGKPHEEKGQLRGQDTHHKETRV